jgi:hypothetical protein
MDNGGATTKVIITNRQTVLSLGVHIAMLANMTRSLAALRNLSRVRVADARKARDDGAAARARSAECRLKADQALDSASAKQKSGSPDTPCSAILFSSSGADSSLPCLSDHPTTSRLEVIG